MVHVDAQSRNFDNFFGCTPYDSSQAREKEKKAAQIPDR